MKNKHKTYFIGFFILVSLAGCQLGLPSQDWAQLLVRTSEWGQMIAQNEQQFVDISQKHQAFTDMLEDSTAIARQQRIQTDSTLIIQIDLLKNGFLRLQHQHTYNLKNLRILREDSEFWIRNNIKSGISATTAHKVWDAKQTQFMRMKDKVDSSAKAFEELEPSYLAIRSRVLP